MPRNLAIFGGTFDPVHLAHLRAALEAAEEVDLDQVMFMPNANPPHDKDLAAGVEHRLEMLKLAVADNPRFIVGNLEAELGGKSYTVNTLTELKRQNPDAHIYFLIGADAFFYLHTWHEPLKLFELADFIVLARPKSPQDELLSYMRRRLDPTFARHQDGWVRMPGLYGAKRIPTTLLSISSTRIRHLAAQGRSLAYLVPPAVEDYIYRMGLYRHPGGQT